MQCTVRETAWYMRGMEDLMMDMMTDDPIAEYILDAVTERALIRAKSFASAGVDLLYLGDDIGMQRTPNQVNEAVLRNLEISKRFGGLLPSPTHMLEPELPWENIPAYVSACADYRKNI